MLISKYRGMKSEFDVANELPTKTIKQLYYESNQEHPSPLD